MKRIQRFFYRQGFKLALAWANLKFKSSALLSEIMQAYYEYNHITIIDVQCTIYHKQSKYRANQWAIHDEQRIHLCSNKCVDTYFAQVNNKFMNDVVNNDGN